MWCTKAEGSHLMNKWKIHLIVWVVAVLIVVLLLWSMQPAQGKDFTAKTDHYYTWGIESAKKLPIQEGSIPTEVTITFKGLTNVAENSTDVMYVHLVDDPPVGFIQNIDGSDGNFFGPVYTAETVKKYTPKLYTNDPNRLASFAALQTTSTASGWPLLLKYQDTTPGKQDVTIKLSEIDHAGSWVWQVYDKPFDFKVANGQTRNYSSALLTFIDYAGNGKDTTLGLGIDPDGQNDFVFDNLVISVRVESYGSSTPYTQQVYTVELNRPPFIFGL